MTWTEVNFDEVNPGQDLIPEGDYTFMVVSAAKGKYDAERSEIRLSIATPGPFQGQTVYLSYPSVRVDKNNPNGGPFNWVVKTIKLFIEAVKPFGYRIAAGEAPVDFVNRITQEADSKNEQILIDARIAHETYADRETGEPITRHKVAFKSVKPCERG